MKLTAKICALLALFQAALLFCTSASAQSLPYSSYIYNKDGEAVAAPAAFVPLEAVGGDSWGIGSLKEPTDLCFSPNGRLYILDAGNNRVVVLDKTLRLEKVLDRFFWQGEELTLNSSGGMTVAEGEILYIADTGNGRILRSDFEGNVLQIIEKPDSALFKEDFQFKPQKLAVDKALRMFVVSVGVNQGLMEYDADGQFTNFMGAPRVTFDFIDYLWKQFSTEAQKDRLERFVPTEYSNVVADADGFLYATISTIDTDKQQAAVRADNRSTQVPVKRMNATGDDILVKNGITAPVGDLVYNNKNGSIQGASAIIDVAVSSDSGMYSLLDSRRGRIFTYDSEGNLMHIFGGMGSQLGTFIMPAAIERIDDTLLVLDKSLGTITLFGRTEYGACLEDAIALYNQGQYEQSVQKWEIVLQHNSNYLPAYSGLGKNYFRNDDYEKAYDYFKLADDRDYQSKAFGYYRDKVLYDYVWLIFLLVLLVAAVGILLFIRKRKRAAAGIETEKYPLTLAGDIRFAFFVIFHPFRGFWDIKHERRDKTAFPLLSIFLLIISFIVKSLYTGSLFNNVEVSEYNLLGDVAKVLIPFFLWCVSSWCFTSLMDGEGSMKDVVTATAYSVVPLILIYIPMTVLSNFMVLEESVYYTFFMSLATIWTAVLIVAGTMITHQYSVSKTILTCILTIIGMGVIIFLALVVYSVIQQVGGFVFNIINEISFRL